MTKSSRYFYLTIVSLFGAVHAAPADSRSARVSQGCETLGNQEITLVAVEGGGAGEKIPASFTPALVERLFNSDKEPRSNYAFWKRVSGGRYQIKAKMPVHYGLTSPFLGDANRHAWESRENPSGLRTLVADILEDLAKKGEDPKKIGRLAIIVPASWLHPAGALLPIRGAGTLGCDERLSGSPARSVLFLQYDALLKSDSLPYQVIVHEYGHNLGLGHAAWLRSTPFVGHEIQKMEYGDPISIMGFQLGFPAVEHMLQLGYLSDAAVSKVDKAKGVMISALDDDKAARITGTKAVRVEQRGSRGVFWLECRKGFRADLENPDSYSVGLYIHYSNPEMAGLDAGQTHYVAQVEAGKSWLDATTGQKFVLRKFERNVCTVDIE